MKKVLLLAFNVVLVVTLSACGSKKDEVVDEGNVGNQETIVIEKVIEKKTSLTEKDLSAIEEESLPVSYTYQTYEGDVNVAIDSGSYIYTTSNSERLIPEYKNISSEKVISSRLEDGFIYTVLDVKFKDGSTGVVSHVNDPESLKYLSTVVEKNGSVVIYDFNY